MESKLFLDLSNNALFRRFCGFKFSTRKLPLVALVLQQNAMLSTEHNALYRHRESV
jgi:hypothetical protein